MKHIICLLSLVMALVTCASCDDLEPLEASEPGYGNYTIDWQPVRFFITAHDAEGRDLLDPELPDNLIEGTTLTFMGRTYTICNCAYERWLETGDIDFSCNGQTKIYAPHFSGLHLVPEGVYFQSGSFGLYFGEIDGAADLDEYLYIHWANGQHNVIRYHCLDHVYVKPFGCDRWYELDGRRQQTSVFDTLIK